MRPLGVIGNLTRDLVAGAAPRVGGGPYHAARALRSLARPAVIACKCSSADRGELLPRVAALGLPVRCLAGGSTATFSIHYDGDAREMRVEALGDPWTPDEARGWVARALNRIDWVHVAPVMRSDFPAETLEQLARGRRLLLDGQGLVRAPRAGPLVLDRDFDPAVLRHVTILKLAEEEAHILLDDFGERSLRSLGVAEVLITLGARGSIVFADGLTEHVSTSPVRGPFDPTGAGDAFAAAYLAARCSGHAPPAAARRASTLVCGLLSGKLA